MSDKQKYRLTNLQLDRVDLVTAGANPGAHIVLFKAEDEDVEKRDFSAEQRRNAAESGAAMPDGSFPIKNRQDLQNAMQSLGRAKNRAAVIAHIKRRAKALGLTNLLNPDIYKSSDTMGDIMDNDQQTETQEVLSEDVEKTDEPQADMVAKADFESLQKSLEDAKAEIAKMQRERKEAEYVAKASEYSNLAKAEDLGPLMLAASEAFSEQQYKMLEQLLKAANAKVESGDLFGQFTKTEGDAADVDVMTRITNLAKAKVDAGQAKTIEIAKQMVLRENRDLQSEYLNARQSVR